MIFKQEYSCKHFNTTIFTPQSWVCSQPTRMGLHLGEKFRPVGSQLSRGGNVPVQRLPGDPQFHTKRADFGFLLAHGGHSQAHLGRCHLETNTRSVRSCTVLTR